MSLNTKVIEVVAKTIRMPIGSLDESSGLGVTDNWDSLAHANLVVELENQFDIQFEFDELDNIITIKAIIESLKNKGVAG